ncbi:MurR/RpiR family transcriptional regulator [Trueperella sp. LYQ143]|uniref:MurR/RpiR family transcriptional regulator n=1 Tax=unclassified Trueperella TaxID=2630174 RepID=UPI003983D8C1
MSTGRNTSLFDRLSTLGNLSPSQQVLADYFVEKYPNLAFRNLEAICADTQLSTASVTRFVRTLGYSGFRDFSRQLQAEVAENFDRPLQREDPHRFAATHLVGDHLHRAATDMQRTAEYISTETFDTVAALVSDPHRPLFLASFASGRSLMTYFALLAKYRRPNVRLLSGIDMTAHDLLDAGENAVLLVTSFDRHSAAMYRIMHAVKQRGGTTILLTNRQTTPLRVHADHMLTVHSSSARFKSRASMIVVLEALLAAMAEHNPDLAQQRTREIEEIIDQLELFILPHIDQ